MRALLSWQNEKDPGGVFVESETGCSALRQRRLPLRSARQARIPEREVIAPQGRRASAPRQGIVAPVPLSDFFRELLSTPGPSGHEAEAAAAWRRSAETFADVSSDSLGSSLARVSGTAGGPSLALVGHIDEIGLAITHVDDKGFLAFRGLGGWLPEVLLAQRVEVLTRDGRLPGVIGKKRGPFKRDKDEKIELKDLFIDIGALDGEEARKL